MGGWVGLGPNQFVYLKWASHLWFSIQSSFFPRENLLGFGWRGGRWCGLGGWASPPPPRGSVDTTRTRSDPQRVRMSSGERPMGAAKGKQSNTQDLLPPPPPKPVVTPNPDRFSVSHSTPSRSLPPSLLSAGSKPNVLKVCCITVPFWCSHATKSSAAQGVSSQGLRDSVLTTRCPRCQPPSRARHQFPFRRSQRRRSDRSHSSGPCLISVKTVHWHCLCAEMMPLTATDEVA